MNGIREVETRAFSKKELIRLLENNFKDNNDSIAVITETTARDGETVIKCQSVTFCIPLRFR